MVSRYRWMSKHRAEKVTEFVLERFCWCGYRFEVVLDTSLRGGLRFLLSVAENALTDLE